MQNDTSRSDEIVTAFAGALLTQQTAELDTREYQDHDGILFEVRGDCLSGPIERGPVVELDLADLTAPRAVAGPPRAPRKHAP